MQSSSAIAEPRQREADSLRACVHDLRNLFAVVASAKSLRERPLDPEKEWLVLDALGRVAVEGKIVTDALLSGAEDGTCGSDTSAELHSLVPVIRALERPALRIELSNDGSSPWILMAPAEYRAVVLELITNAGRAGAGRIQVRSARRGFWYWLIVADDGSGFPTEARLERPAGLNGTGTRRLASAVRAAHGKLKIRSKTGRGSVVALILPIIRIVPPSDSDEAPAVRSLATA
jgi:signal transduction histidine kinase